MHSIETESPMGTLRLTGRSRDDVAGLRRAAQQIRWLPGVLAVADGNGEIEVLFRAPAEELLRQIHQTLAGNRGFPKL
jgi:hypothetical protein